MNLPKTGYTASTAANYLLNAGALVKNLKWETDAWKFDLIGATSGGSKIVAKTNLRQVEVDGVFTTPVGGDQVESTESSFEINLIEHTLENYKSALFATEKASDGTAYPEGYQVLETKSKVTAADYIENLAYIGTISGSDKPIIIIMHHSICTSGLELSPEDKKEAVITLTFEGRVAADNVNDVALPITVLIPTATTVEGVMATSAEAPTVKVDGLESKDETTATTKGGTK